MPTFDVTVIERIRSKRTYRIEAASKLEAKDKVYNTEDEPIDEDTLSSEFGSILEVREVTHG
jgi:hypothetical protein